MTITAQIIADSISPEGIRLTTMQLRYPRFIHAEFMTHRMFSRNASSSRAIPVKKMIEDLRRDPAMPVYWGSNQKGMQAGSELKGNDLDAVRTHWLDQMETSINTAFEMVDRGLHKQIANRILEPWAHINVVVTATDWDNFFALRRHADAQPEIKALADAMWEVMEFSQPAKLQPGEWHLPYINKQTRDQCIGYSFEMDDETYAFNFGNTNTRIVELETMKKVSVARCARVSYLTHDGRKATIEEDLALYERLVGAHPMHASPAEHQATPAGYRFVDNIDAVCWQREYEHGNFRGWIQYRKTLPGENMQD